MARPKTTSEAPESAAAPTFDEVDRHVRGVDPAVFGAGAEGTRAAPNPAGVLKQIGAAYAAVKPVLGFVRPFVPGPWRAVFDGFTAALDAVSAAQ